MKIFSTRIVTTLVVIAGLGTGSWLLFSTRLQDNREHIISTADKLESYGDLKILSRSLDTLVMRVAQLENRQHIESKDMGNENTQSLYKEVAALKNRLSLLEDKQRILSQDLVSERSRETELFADAQVGEEGTDSTNPWPEQSDEKKLEGESHEEEKTQELISKHEATFLHESDDPDSSIETEELITQALDNKLEEGSSLLLVECHAILCRLEISHESDGSRENFLNNLPLDEEAFFYPRADGENSLDTVMFVSRIGIGFASMREK